MYQSLRLKKKSPPKVKLTQTNAHLNERVPQSISMEDKQSVQASVKRKISIETPAEQKKIKDFFSFNDQRIKAKSIVISYIDNVMKASSLSDDIFRELQRIEKSSNFEQMIENILKVMFQISEDQKHKYLHKYLKKQKSKHFQKEVSLTVRKKEAQLLRIIKEERETDQNQRSKSRRKYDEMYSEHETMKKQIFEVRQEKLQLQRKILQIIEQFRNRKTFYLAQIKKLTDIVNMSSFDVRHLVMQKTREAKQLQSKLDQSREQIKSAIDVIVNQRNTHQTQEERDGYHSPSSNTLTFNHYAREDSRIHNGYNTELKILKGVSSIQKIDQFHHDHHVNY